MDFGFEFFLASFVRYEKTKDVDRYVTRSSSRLNMGVNTRPNPPLASEPHKQSAFHTSFIPIDQNPPTNENPKKHVDENGQHSAHSNTDRENHHYFQSSWPTSIFTNNQQSTVVALYNPFVYIYSRKFFSYLEYIILQHDLTNWFPTFYSSCWIC